MQKDVGKRIAEARKERGYTQEQLAEMSMISRITLARYETGAIEPGAFAVSRIADALNVSTDELLCRVEKQPPFVGMVKHAVPIIGAIACGQPITAEQNVDGYADLPDGIFADFALRCKGESMTPTFQDGDIVLIRQQPDVEPGQIAAVGIDGEATLKRFYPQENSVLLVADNPAFAPIIRTGDVKIYGKAIGFARMFRG